MITGLALVLFRFLFAADLVILNIQNSSTIEAIYLKARNVFGLRAYWRGAKFQSASMQEWDAHKSLGLGIEQESGLG